MAASIRAAEPPAARLAGGDGLLAGRADQRDPWRILRIGDPLPPTCQLRGAGGACRLQTPSANVDLIGDARVRLDVARRLLAVEAGTVFVNSTERTLPVKTKEPWACESEGLRAEIQAGSVVEVSVEPRRHVAIGVLEGLVEARAPGGLKPDRAAAKTRWIWQPSEKRVFSAPLSPQEEKRLAARAAPARPAQGGGQLMVKDSQSGSPVRLSPAQYRAHVVLHPPVALVQIDQSFYNPTDRQTEGTFVFNLPKGASVSRFAMYVDARSLIEGELIERQRAGEIYDTIVHRRRDPAILEQIGDNLFKMRVFPISPRDFKRILLDFTLPLESDDGQFHFDVPLLTDLEPIWDFQVTGEIRGPTRPESVASLSHPKLKFIQRKPGEIGFEWKEANFRPRGDLSLSFVQPVGNAPSLRSYTAGPLPMPERRPDRPQDPLAGRAATYFLATLPPEAAAPAVPPAAADVVVVADTSAGVKNRRGARQTVRMIVQNLPSGSRLRLACADVSCRWLHDGWIAPDGPEARQALQRLDKGVFLGALDLKAALEEVLKCLSPNVAQPPSAVRNSPTQPGAAVPQVGSGTGSKAFPADNLPRRRILIFVGAGNRSIPGPRDRELADAGNVGGTSGATSGRGFMESLAGRFAKAKVAAFTASVEPESADTLELETLAAASGGMVFHTARRDQRKDLWAWVLEGLPNPRPIVRLEVEGAGSDDLFYPGAWLPGRGLTVMGRTGATQRVVLSLTVQQAGKPATRRYDLKVDLQQDDVFLGRLWAQRALERLYPTVRSAAAGNPVAGQPPVNPSDDPVRQQVLALAQEWSLLTPYTAFLVLESDADYQRWNVKRSMRRRYWVQDEAVAAQAPLEGDAYAALRAKLAQDTAAREEAAKNKRFEQAFQSAREAMKAGNHRLAHAVLSGVAQLPAAAKSKEYADLKREAEALVRRDERLEALGPHRFLWMPPAQPELDRFQASIAPLLAARSHPEFDRYHPYAGQLLKEIRVAPETMTLAQLVSLLAKETGVNVVPDLKALEEVGISFDFDAVDARGATGVSPVKPSNTGKIRVPPGGAKPGAGDDSDPFANPSEERAPRRDSAGKEIDAARQSLNDEITRQADESFRRVAEQRNKRAWRFLRDSDGPVTSLVGWGRMSIRSYAKFVLAQQGLVLVEEPHRLLITTPDEAANRLRTRIYPVADLFLADEAPEPASLADPYLDREMAAGDRIRKKLQRPISVKYREPALEDVLKDVARALDDNVLVDMKALEEVGMSLDKRINAVWRDVPIKESLRWILHQEGLTYTIEGESLVITTPDQADNRLEVRLHSGRGLMMQPSPREMERLRAQGGTGGNGMGMGGSFMGAMGGMGGGFFGGGGGRLSRGMGGSGGAMGGMGGGMGGMGGGMAGAMGPPPSANPEQFSSGGDAQAAPEPAESDSEMSAEEEEPPEQEPEVAPLPGSPPARHFSSGRRGDRGLGSLADFGGGASMVDFDSEIDLITSTIQPTTWDEVGGPGSIAFFEPTLDFVLAATEDVHEEVDALFDGLRKMKVPGGPRKAWVPAEVSRVPAEVTNAIDFDSLIDLITSTVQPTTWDSVGGPGSIAPDEPRAALVISQTDDVQDAVAGLLTLLRRSRYEALRGSRPWEVFEAGTGPWIGNWSLSPRWTGASLAKLPGPRAEALQALLGVRRELPLGYQLWRRSLPGGPSLDKIRLASSPAGLVVELPGRRISTLGNDADIAYPDLLLMERGPWGEAVREWLDGRLPWMPHRTNAELARLFDVRPAPDRPADKDSKNVRLRLTLPGCADPEKTYIEATFSRENGLPLAWETHFDGRLTQRFRFGQLRIVKGIPQWSRVVLEDPSGKAPVEWTANVGIPASPPDLAKGYVEIDRRYAQPQIDAAFSRALAAIRGGAPGGLSASAGGTRADKLPVPPGPDWPAAVKELKATLAEHPRHPLVLLLLAWCWEHQPGLAPRAQYLQWLRDAASDVPGPARFIAQGNFLSLQAAERYEILARQPAELHSGEDQEHLARAALAADRLPMALEHAQAALTHAQGPSEALRSDRLRIEILLRLGRHDRAGQEAWSRGTRPETPPTEAAELALLLARHGVRETADRLFDAALGAKDLPPSTRGDLLRRRAEVQSGLARWRSLLEAATLVRRTSPERTGEFAQVLSELTAPADAPAAATLAQETKDARLRAGLLVRQAELAIGPKVAADLAWQVHEMGQLPVDRHVWSCRLWNAANQPARVIDLLEERLRRGHALGGPELAELAAAYRQAHRPVDAERAATTPPAPPPQKPSQPAPQGMGGGMF